MKRIKEHEEPNALVQAAAVLDTWSADKWIKGLQINELDQLETLSVETMNHTYEITIINPATAEVMVRGGDFFPERTVAELSGASFGGSFLKLHGIYVGFKMEFRLGDGRIITSPVRGIGLVTSD